MCFYWNKIYKEPYSRRDCRTNLAVEQDINDKISNVVFMGIGEPFDNYDNVKKAINIINNQKGLNIGARHISISTSGIVPMIYKFAMRKCNVFYQFPYMLQMMKKEAR